MADTADTSIPTITMSISLVAVLALSEVLSSDGSPGYHFDCWLRYPDPVVFSAASVSASLQATVTQRVKDILLEPFVAQPRSIRDCLNIVQERLLRSCQLLTSHAQSESNDRRRFEMAFQPIDRANINQNLMIPDALSSVSKDDIVTTPFHGEDELGAVDYYIASVRDPYRYLESAPTSSSPSASPPRFDIERFKKIFFNEIRMRETTNSIAAHP